MEDREKRGGGGVTKGGIVNKSAGPEIRGKGRGQAKAGIRGEGAEVLSGER